MRFASNIILRDYTIPDPALTPLGLVEQCQELKAHLQENVPLARDIELIVISPMRRTMQTAEQALGWLMEQGVPVQLRAEWQENSAKPCDTGTPIPLMLEEWSQFNWSTVDPLYPSKTGLYEFSKDAITRRGIEARSWLKNRPERVIAVVSHAGFLRVGASYRKYRNADFRIFDFDEGDEFDAEGGRLIEWELTENRGGGLGKSEKGIYGWETQDFPEKDNDDSSSGPQEAPA
jgi:broad specificity phosphatase PhoE